MDTLLAIGVVSALAAALAAALTVAERFIADYGACTITVNDDRRFEVAGGGTLLESLSRNNLFIPSACGGRGTCAYCKVKVLEGAGPVLPTEEPYLDAAEREDGMRLSCQVKVRRDLRIRIPDELFNVRPFAASCVRIRELTRDIREFRLDLNDPAEIEYVPGQYIQLQAPAYDGNEEVYRAYSISSDPAEPDAIDLVIRLVPGGICTTWCFEHLHEKDPVSFNGPYGEFRLSETDAPMILVAGGSGMAPIKCILHHMQNRGCRRDAIYFFGANRVDELFYLDRMRQFEKDLAHFTFVPVVARPEAGASWNGETGLVTEALERSLTDASKHEGYLCGSPGLIAAAREVLTKLGMPEEKIYYDAFA